METLAKAIGTPQEKAETTAAVEMAIRTPLPVADRESGMVVRKVVCWEVTDAAALYAKFPHFFRLEPNKSVINASVTANTVAPGLRVWEETKTTVRT